MRVMVCDMLSRRMYFHYNARNGNLRNDRTYRWRRGAKRMNVKKKSEACYAWENILMIWEKQNLPFLILFSKLLRRIGDTKHLLKAELNRFALSWIGHISKNAVIGMLRHSFWRELILVSLQRFVAPALDLMPCLQ